MRLMATKLFFLFIFGAKVLHKDSNVVVSLGGNYFPLAHL